MQISVLEPSLIKLFVQLFTFFKQNYYEIPGNTSNQSTEVSESEYKKWAVGRNEWNISLTLKDITRIKTIFEGNIKGARAIEVGR